MANAAPSPPVPPLRRTTTRLSRETVWLVVGVLCGALLLYTFITLSQRRKQQSKPVGPPKPSLYEVSGEARPDVRLRTQAKYAGWNREDPLPQPPADPLPPATAPSVASLVPTPHDPVAPPASAPPPTARPGPAPPPARQAAPAGRTGQPPARPKKWLEEASKSTVEAPPFPLPPPPEGMGPAGGRGSRLFPKAVWEHPAHPERVLYADYHLIQGQLLQNINTDIPSSIRILVTEAVEDRFGQGHILIPQGSTLLAEQEGKASYGQSRIPIRVVRGSFPNGVAIEFPQAQGADQQGAAGIPAKVNNHWGSTLVGVGLSAVLSIGARAPFGSTDQFQYQPSLEQEFAKDVSQDLNRAGQKFIEREFMRAPTLTQKAGYPVTISFKENVSFMTKPVKVAQ